MRPKKIKLGRRMAESRRNPGLRVRLGEKQWERYVRAQQESGDKTLSDWARRVLDLAASGQAPQTVSADPEYRAALDRIKAHIRQTDDSSALRYAVLVAAELMDDPAGGSPVKP